MKGKKLLIGGSILAALGLVGGTFAKWALTDNADPFNIKVSTGEVPTEDTEYLTLEWGESQNMSNVSNLAMGTIRKAGVLDLRGKTTSTTAISGVLSLEITGGTHIAAGIDVNIYPGDITATSGVIAPAALSGITALTFVEGKSSVTINKNVANLYTVAVNLKSSVDAVQLDQMKGETAEIEFDWGMDDSQVLNSYTLYATGFSAQPYVYAWNGSKVNASWPGIAMTPVAGATGYYTAEVETTFTKVVFTTSDESQKSGDITIADSFYTETGHEDLFTFDSTVETVHGTFSKMGDVKQPEYYLTGSFTTPAWTTDPANLSSYKMTYVAASGTPGSQGYVEEHYTLANFVAAANAELKVYEVLGKQWYSSANPWEGCNFEVTADGNVKLPTAGTYTINLYLSGTNGNYVVPSLHNN